MMWRMLFWPSSVSIALERKSNLMDDLFSSDLCPACQADWCDEQGICHTCQRQTGLGTYDDQWAYDNEENENAQRLDSLVGYRVRIVRQPDIFSPPISYDGVSLLDRTGIVRLSFDGGDELVILLDEPLAPYGQEVWVGGLDIEVLL